MCRMSLEQVIQATNGIETDACRGTGAGANTLPPEPARKKSDMEPLAGCAGNDSRLTRRKRYVFYSAKRSVDGRERPNDFEMGLRH